MLVDIKLGNCLDQMRIVDAASIDSIVTDPPYGLSFMGWGWDHGVPGVEFWAEALRVAKPGAHLLAFGGTRTYHRLACAIEDAGWEIRNCVMWIYGSGFPKSLDVSKAIDKAAGAEREVIMRHAASVGFDTERQGGGGWSAGELLVSAPATDAARQWSGWGTALKPAWEPIIVARKPLCGTVAENVLKHGTGGINVDGCRVGTESTIVQRAGPSADLGYHGNGSMPSRTGSEAGRWPANFIHDGSEEVTGLLGNAVRFFYCAKASKADRDEGCEAFEEKELKAYSDFSGTDEHSKKANVQRRNNHPTVKPTALMRYLCRLVTPPGGVVLDPFCGSGSTGKAAILEGFRFMGIEREAKYVEIAKARIASAIKKKQSLGSGDQCVSRLPIGNSDSSGSVSPLRITCDANPECGTRSNLHDNKRNKAICTTSHVQLLLFEEAE